MVCFLFSQYPEDFASSVPSIPLACSHGIRTKTFRFLALPPEIRNMIYREALIPRSPKGIQKDVRALAHPPLARVSKQLRAESLPILYGDNSFSIRIGALSDERFQLQQCRRRVDAAYKRYIAMFEAFSASGDGAPGTSCVHHIKRVSITYEQHLWDRTPSVGLIMGAPRPASRDNVRICQGVADWADFPSVRAALLNEMEAWVSVSGGETLSWLFPSGRVAAILWFCAKECPLAAEHVEL